MKPDPTYLGNSAPPIKLIFVLAFFMGLEFGMWVLFYATYTETIGLMSDFYLIDLPLIGPIVGVIDEEISAAHLLCMALAFFSVATPLYLWSLIIKERIYENPQEWLSHPQNQVYAVAALMVFAMVFLVEAVNLYALIAREAVPNPFVTKQSTEMMEYLSANRGMGVFVSILIAVINAVIALLTAKSMHELKTAWKEA